MQESKFKNYFLLHLIIFIWGFTAILGALISIDAIPLVWYRMLLASIFTAIYFLIKKKSFSIDLKALLRFFFSGTVIALHWIFFFKAIKVSNVSVALVTMSTGAFFVSFIEPIFFKRKIRIVEVALGLGVILGLYVIFNFETQYKLGILFALIASFLSALFSVLNGLFVKQYKPSQISFYQLLFGTVFISIYLFIIGGFSEEFFQLSKTDWFYLLILSSVCTAFAFIIAVRVMKVVSPFTVVLSNNLEPVYAIVLALLIFWEKEQMTPAFYIGAFVIFLLVLLNGLIKNRHQIKKKLITKRTIKK
jgi:drug/metabolite transporter (DMT)-like permease